MSASTKAASEEKPLDEDVRAVLVLIARQLLRTADDAVDIQALIDEMTALDEKQNLSGSRIHGTRMRVYGLCCSSVRSSL